MLLEKLKLLPDKPGCYQMKNIDGEIIYVGKAKNLKSRVSSYFTGSHDYKTEKMISNINDFEYIITNTEAESLVLELNLIKEYKPKYNILLKDDKTYPYIEITNEKIPRLNIVRNTKNKKSKLFGPYPNVTAARETVNLLNRIYPLRKCIKLPNKTCLYYHIDQCLGYCVYSIEKKILDDMILDITKFLNGDHSLITKKIKEDIKFHSENLQFEKCIELKEILDYIEITLDRQKININDFVNRDIFSYSVKDSYMSIQVFFLRRGVLVERKSEIIPIIEEETEELIRYISMFYEKNIKPKEIIIPNMDYKVLEEVLGISVVVPIKGIKKTLLDLATKNAKEYLLNEFSLITKNEEKKEKAKEDLKKLLGIPKVETIELFDNSHLFGTYTVSAMVSFNNFEKDKNNYRKYKISNDLKDDYNIMKEVIYRRYFRILKENLKRPDLIIVDGGIIQVNATREVLEQLNMNIKVIGLKKDDKHKTNVIFDYDDIVVDKHSELYTFIGKMQEEVHRFAITYHRDIRTKGNFESILDKVGGIGIERKKILIKHFGSVDNIKNSTLEEIEKIIPKTIAVKLYTYLKEEL